MQTPNTSTYRYPGSRPFQAGDAQLFYGRDKEKKDLYNLVMVEKIVAVFAQSGIGKTSLIQAGLIPLLETTDLQPIFIRFNEGGTTPLEQFGSQYIGNTGKQVSEKTLWELIKYNPLTKNGKPAIPLLVLDQFEELFTLHNAEARNAFIQEFADVANGRVPNRVQQDIRTAIANNKDISDAELAEMERAPNLHILIALRSDFLHLLDDISPAIPNILRSRFQLFPLAPEQAREAIVRPAQLEDTQFECPPFEFTEAAIQDILQNLQNSRKEIESFQLQILCRHIEEKHSHLPIAVSPAFYGGKAGIQAILNNFYNDQIEKLPVEMHEIARKMIEEGLITESERRRSMDEADLKQRYGATSALLTELVAGRLLRKEPRLDTFYYEISHDTLVQPILISFKARKARIKAAEEVRKAKIAAEQQQADIRRLEAEKEAQAAALAAEKQRTEAEKQLRQQAESAQKRATRFAVGAGVLALVAILIGILAWTLQKKAEEQTKIAEEQKTKIEQLLVGERIAATMVHIPAGTFEMGNNEGQDDQKPIHTVTLDSFWISKYEVTQAQWKYVMGASTTLSNPSHFKDCDDCPVEKVSYDDIQEFLQKLNASTGKKYRLPTEAEWEYAAKGGQKYEYSGSDNVDEVAWSQNNSEMKTHPVGKKKSNDYGLYDMSGNVWEWCEDYYDENFYKNSKENNHNNTTISDYRVLRGGSWNYYDYGCRVSYRYNYVAAYGSNFIGFRVVR